jgi:threonine dehydratase
MMVVRGDVEAAARRIAPHVRRTPVLELSERAIAPQALITLKLEFLQHTGSFKARGAFNKLLQLGAPTTVVAASGGNHGAAVAYAAGKLGGRAEIFVPTFASASKIKRIEDYGARVTPIEGHFGDVVDASVSHAKRTGAAFVHAFDDVDVIAGQGTATLEFKAQAAFDTLLVAVGGGGLAGGAVAALNGGARVVAVETEGTAAYHAAREKGAPTPWQASGIAADSLGANQIGAAGFALLNAADVQSVVVPDVDVLAAQRWLWAHVRIASEPGGATAFAALLSGAYAPAKDERVGVLVCGANTDLDWAR